MRRHMLISAISAGLLCGGLTTSAPAEHPVGTYIVDRFHDTLDLFRIRGGAPSDGKAIGLKARATTLLQAGYVAFDGKYAGMDRRAIGIVDEHRREAGISAAYGSYNEMIPVMGNTFWHADSPWSQIETRRLMRNLPHWDDGRRRHLSLGAEVATPLFAVDLGVYPEEAVDLVLGVFTIDIFNDDRLRGYEEPYQEAETIPVPEEEAVFAEKRQELDEFKAKMVMKEMENLGQLEEGEIPEEGTMPEGQAPQDAVPGQAPMEEEPAGPTSEGMISPDEADESIRELDEQLIQEEERLLEEAQQEEPAQQQESAEPEAETEATEEPADADASEGEAAEQEQESDASEEEEESASEEEQEG